MFEGPGVLKINKVAESGLVAKVFIPFPDGFFLMVFSMGWQKEPCPGCNATTSFSPAKQ